MQSATVIMCMQHYEYVCKMINNEGFSLSLFLYRCGCLMQKFFHSLMMSGPGFLSTSPESSISSISAFITDFREVVATRHSNKKMLLRRTGT